MVLHSSVLQISSPLQRACRRACLFRRNINSKACLAACAVMLVAGIATKLACNCVQSLARRSVCHASLDSIMDDEFRPVVRKQRHKQSVPFVTQVSEVLNKLYAEGLRHIELDEDSRAYLNSASTDVQVKALTQLLRKRREAKVNNPSAFLTQAIKSSELVHGTAKVPNNRVNNATATYTKPDLCQSANQLLGWLHKEGLEPSQLDEACFAYLARCPPAIQTKALTNMLQQWRGQVAIVNPSAYLTKLLANAYHEDPPHEQDLLHAAKPDAQVEVRAATHSHFVPYKQSDFVPFKQSEFASNTASVDNVTAALGDLSPISDGHSIGTNVWPAVSETTVPALRSTPVSAKECSAVESAIMRCFANRFVVMNAEDLSGLQTQDLQIVLNIKGNPGITAALDQATEAAQMASLYDMLDEAGQREVLLRELEYAAEVAVDKLSQDGLV